MQNLNENIVELKNQITKAYSGLDIVNKIKKVTALKKEMTNPSIWNNTLVAQAKSKELSDLDNLVTPWQKLMKDVSELEELAKLDDSSLADEINSQLDDLQASFNQQKRDLLFQGQYDNYDAILRLSAGVGGTDAQDWTSMLERMYLRWCEKTKDIKAKVIDESAGEEAGVKSCIIEASGPHAYGLLKSENGVHRLVRLSPFNSEHLRQTSFALVEVLPKVSQPGEVEINPKDIRIDVYHSGGHGGQGVNTTDSAVRLTHFPTGIIITIQNERSQIQNRETAMEILRSKLLQLQLEQHAKTIADLRAGESANWGSQIRNYVFQPYTLVKDLRTKHETHDVESVLNGNIDDFIIAYLEKTSLTQTN